LEKGAFEAPFSFWNSLDQGVSRDWSAYTLILSVSSAAQPTLPLTDRCGL
jgi:hypothetical protein